MGPPRTDHKRGHPGTVSRRVTGNRSGSVCELRALHASYRARARKLSRTRAEDAGHYAWLELLRQWRTSLARSGCRHARGTRAQSPGGRNDVRRPDQSLKRRYSSGGERLVTLASDNARKTGLPETSAAVSRLTFLVRFPFPDTEHSALVAIQPFLGAARERVSNRSQSK